MINFDLNQLLNTGGGNTNFSLMQDPTQTVAPSVVGGSNNFAAMAPSIFDNSGAPEARQLDMSRLLSMENPTAPPIDSGNLSWWDKTKNAFGSLAQDAKNTPQKWEIVLDALGSKLAPNNAFAGIGTMLAKSQLASQARNAQNASIGDILAGKQPAPAASGVAPNANTGVSKTYASGKLAGADRDIPTTTAIPGLTPAATAGITSQTQQARPDGTVETTTKHTTPAPVKNVPGTISQSDLTGLSPAEINAIAGKDQNIGALAMTQQKNQATAAYQNELARAANATVEDKNYANRALALQRLATAKKAETEAAIARDESPIKIDKLRTELAKLEQERQGLELGNAQAWERQTIINKLLANGGDYSSLSDGELLTLMSGANVTSLRNKTLSETNKLNQNQIENEQRRRTAHANAAANAFNAEKPAAAIGDINRANFNADPRSTRVLMYNNGDGLFNTEKVEWRELPKTSDGKQVTMGDILENARTIGLENAIKRAFSLGQRRQ